jgi:hypothetical protein
MLPKNGCPLEKYQLPDDVSPCPVRVADFGSGHLPSLWDTLFTPLNRNGLPASEDNWNKENKDSFTGKSLLEQFKQCGNKED